MSPFLFGLLAGVLGTLACSITFVLFAMWHAKRHPLLSEQFEHVPADEYSPPSYWRSPQ